MGEMLQLRAVVEAPCPPTRLVYPWAIAKIKPFSMIRLSVETSPEEIGLIILQLADYNKASISADARDTIDQILALDGAVLPGGIQIHGEGEKTISPGCCCGLEGWYEWFDFLKTGHSPWMGHDPWPTLTKKDSLVRICSDKESRKCFFLESSYSHFKTQLKQVEKDLMAFAYCLETWAKNLEIERNQELRLKFSEWFGIRDYFTYEKEGWQYRQ